MYLIIIYRIKYQLHNDVVVFIFHRFFPIGGTAKEKSNLKKLNILCLKFPTSVKCEFCLNSTVVLEKNTHYKKYFKIYVHLHCSKKDNDCNCVTSDSKYDS